MWRPLAVGPCPLSSAPRSFLPFAIRVAVVRWRPIKTPGRWGEEQRQLNIPIRRKIVPQGSSWSVCKNPCPSGGNQRRRPRTAHHPACNAKTPIRPVSVHRRSLRMRWLSRRHVPLFSGTRLSYTSPAPRRKMPASALERRLLPSAHSLFSFSATVRVEARKSATTAPEHERATERKRRYGSRTDRKAFRNQT